MSIGVGNKAGSRKVIVSLLPYALLSASVVALYGKCAGFDFIPSWDDDAYVINNLLIRSFSLANLRGIFTGTFVADYAPVDLLSFSADYFFWGLNPAGYHVTNLVLHALNVILAFLVVRRIAKRGDVAFISALLFAIHPVNVENVAWVSERKTLVSVFFTFLALLSYLKFREREGGMANYALCAVFFVLAVLSKSSAVTLPLAMIAYEIFINGERKWKYSIPFFAISMLGALTVFAHLRSNNIETGPHALAMLLGTVYPTMLPVYWKYVLTIIWPMNLSGFYDAPYYHSFLDPVVLVSLIGWIMISGVIFWKCGNGVRFWYLWFWIWFLPVSNIIPIPVFYADRYMYMPAIGAFSIMAMFITGIFGGLSVRMQGMSMKKAFGYVAITVIVSFYAIIAFNRLDVWQNEVVFWEDTVSKSPNQFKPHVNLGYAYDMRGRYIEAESQYEAAQRIYPGDMGVLENLRMVRIKKMLKYGR